MVGSTRRDGRHHRAQLALVMAAALIAVGCSSTSSRSDATSTTSHSAGSAHANMNMGVGPPPTWSDGSPAVPTRHTGPQGATGQFVAKCLYSHSATADPIVFPGSADKSHRHDFYGAVNTDGNSTPESMLDTETTCNKPGDSAAYWQPTLYDHDIAVVPTSIHAYYRAAPGIDPENVEPFPFGLALIAGDALATTPQSGEAAGWTCGVRTSLSPTPPDCDPTAPLHLVLTFPDCWDGKHLDSEDHRTHATYSRNGKCPASHPVSVPQLTVSVNFPINGTGHEFRLASGNVYSAHGDFFNSWNVAAQRREVEHCIHRGVVCDLASNREEDGPFFTN